MVEMIRDVIASFFDGMESWEYYLPILDILTIITVILIFVFIVKVFTYFTRITRNFIGRRY